MSQRLVIPIDDEAGRLVGYGGRSLDGSEPRYRFPAGFANRRWCSICIAPPLRGSPR